MVLGDHRRIGACGQAEASAVHHRLGPSTGGGAWGAPACGLAPRAGLRSTSAGAHMLQSFADPGVLVEGEVPRNPSRRDQQLRRLRAAVTFNARATALLNGTMPF